MLWQIFAACLAACAAPAVSAMLFKLGAWYAGLSKPWWTPPNWAFPVVWLILYTSMSVAAARVAVSPEGSILIALWATQIAFNTLWSGVFFGLRDLRAGLFIMAALWLAVLVHMIVSWRYAPGSTHARRAAILFGLVTLQATLGIITLLTYVPLGWALAHQATALIVLCFAVAHWRGLKGPMPLSDGTPHRLQFVGMRD